MFIIIGILTFHRSHNYGSVFQSYALQYWLQIHGYQNEIIDLYTNKSIALYAIIHCPNSVLQLLKIPFWLMLYKKNKKKWNLFYSFQNNVLALSKEKYADFNALKQGNLQYTTYITGSDQIWNTACFDFNWAYFLAFVTNRCNKVAYAPSAGSIGIKEQSPKIFNSIRQLLGQYNSISVREKGTADFLEKITGKRPVITVDPVFLVDKNIWINMLENREEVKTPEHYIFFYTLKHEQSEYRIVREIAFLLKLPVIITNVPPKRELFGFKWKIEAGPWDFLYLIQHADLVLTSSFHGTAFSIIFEKLFYSINGAQDNRISSLLHSLNISDRALSLDKLDDVIVTHDVIDYASVKRKLSKEIQQSEEFLYTALKGEENGILSS